MSDSGALFPVLFAVLAAAAYYVWLGLGLSAVFGKAGEERFTAWIPIWNTVTLLRLGGLSGWLVLVSLVPILGALALLVVMVIAFLRINRAFGFGIGMTVLAVVLLPLWASIVGWGSARWLGTGIRRHGDESAPLDARVTPSYAAASAPPRPLYTVPPAAASGPLPPAPVAAPPLPPVDSVPVSRPLPPMPPAELDDTDLLMGRSLSPFTETAPSSFPAPHDAPPPAIAPRRAFTPSPGEAPVPVDSFSTLDAVPARARSAAAAADAPVQSVPAAPPAPSTDPWAPPAPAAAASAVSAVPAPVAWHASQPLDDSAEVSAIAGAPVLDAPRSARQSVSAQHGLDEIPDLDAFDETIIAVRRRPAFVLIPPLGAPIPITSDVLIVGRRPGSDPARPDAQLVPVVDATRTVSKTHARLERGADGWTITDLDSTNGVVLIADDGMERDAAPGVAEPLTARFLLGDAELRLDRADAGGSAR